MRSRSEGRAGSGARAIRGWLHVLPAAAILGALAIAYAFGLHQHLRLDALAARARDLDALVDRHLLAAPIVYVIVYTATVAVSIPGASILTILGGFLFGWWFGGILAVVAATAGATLVFLAARTSIGDRLAARGGPRLKRLSDGFAENAFSYLLFLRFAPVFPFWLVNLAPALMGMRLLPYVVGTAIGIVPATFAYAYAGEGLEALVDRNGPLLPPKLILAFAVLAVVALLPVIVRRIRGNAAGRGNA
ncbi:TVP38/TMEM64 family protein [Faunimonas sp. B44]|uniref:TVP38/TMEM64 family protein n=1 Tax=Faunimonas sp. B44 TaxID=3461493 RepID=UPI004043C170